MMLVQTAQSPRTRTARSRLRRSSRRAAAAVEAALVLPFLLGIFVVSVDLARAFYTTQVISDCARETALFAANPDLSDRTRFESAAELADEYLRDVQPTPVVTLGEGTDARGDMYVEVTINHKFRCICPLLPDAVTNLTRTARARLFPSAVEERRDE